MDLEILNESRIGLLGYGAQGAAEAENLRRSHVTFKLGLRPEGASAERAKSAGFQIWSIEDVVSLSDTIVLNLPDQEQASIYREYIQSAPHIKRIVFAHGFNTHFGLIPVFSKGPQHYLVAPKGAAGGLVEFYGTQNALAAILAIRSEGKITNDDRRWAEAYALAIGCHPHGLIWADFKDETECDLFSEQALLCGGVSSLLRTAYEVLVENGYHPEAAYFETLYELKLIVDLMWKRGITGMREKISPTARYGDITRGDRIIDHTVKARMQEVLEEIQRGEFAKEFLKEFLSPEFKRLEFHQSQHAIERIGKKLRDRMQRSQALASAATESRDIATSSTAL